MQYAKTLIIALAAVAALAPLAPAEAKYTSGYMRQDGTYVAPHYSSNPNNSVTDNYGYRGNTNPYTGETGTNAYGNSPSSQYYNGYGNPYGGRR